METSKDLLNQYLSTDSNAKSIGSVTFVEMLLLSNYRKHLSKGEEWPRPLVLRNLCRIIKGKVNSRSAFV